MPQRLAAVLGTALLAAPLVALAHGPVQVQEAATWASYAIPSVVEVEAAIEDAAAEFAVPESLLLGIAHLEGGWEHRPQMEGPGGRRGLFQTPLAMRSEAAELLDLDLADVTYDLVGHVRGFAALLDAARPPAGPFGLGPWRDSVAWAAGLEEGVADLAVDQLFLLVDQGLIDRLPSGEPVAIPPQPIHPDFLGLFAASGVTGCRSTDYPGADYDPTPCNYSPASRTTGDVEAVIIHTIEGSYWGAISWFHNCSAQVSAHYVLSEQGDITQVVDEADIGWHVSCWNSFSIGLEHEGYASNTYHADAMVQASAALTADILADWNIPADRDHVVGHVEIDPECNSNAHWDPGPGWDWDYYMSLVGGTSDVDTTQLVGYVRHTDLYDASFGIPGASVEIVGVGTAESDSSGYFAFDDLAAGTYTVCASAVDYDQACREKTIEIGLTNWASLLLEEAEPSHGDDDDDTSEAGDDDAGDDDSSENEAGDDDTAQEAPDVALGGAPVAVRGNSSDVVRRGCMASIGGAAPAGWWSSMLLLVLTSCRRRRRTRGGRIARRS